MFEHPPSQPNEQLMGTVLSPHTEFVGALQRRSADAANHRAAVAADQGIVHRTGAVRAIKVGHDAGLGHNDIMERRRRQPVTGGLSSPTL